MWLLYCVSFNHGLGHMYSALHCYVSKQQITIAPLYHCHIIQLDSLSTGAAVSLTFVVIVTLIIDTVITFIVTYICVKRKFEKILQDHLKDKQQNKTVLYEQIVSPDQTITKNDMELQPNPAYGTSHKVTMDTNPAYESYQ